MGRRGSVAFKTHRVRFASSGWLGTRIVLSLVSDSLRPSNRVSGVRPAALGKLGLSGPLHGTVTAPSSLIDGLVFGLSSSLYADKKRPAGARPLIVKLVGADS
jgi:hypothetical protein